MGSTIITKTKLYRTDPVTKIPTLAYGIGASVPVDEYERLTGQAAPAEPQAALTASAPTQAAEAPAAAPAKANPTVAELKARLDELGVEYPKRARLPELTELVAAAEADAAAKAAIEADGDDGDGTEDDDAGEGEGEGDQE